MNRIPMKTPLVEMDGDEMTRILWQMIKDELLLPFVDLKTEYYDLGLANRDATGDQVTVDAAMATKKYSVAVKCATITPNAQRVEEYHLKEMWKSPNGTIRALLDGTVFRAPIMVNNVKPLVPTWEKPITIARHAYGDIYKNVEAKVPAGARAHLLVEKDGVVLSDQIIHRYEGDGIAQGVHNTVSSITSFARSCFEFALSQGQDLWFGTKDTISKTYDHTFKDIFQEICTKPSITKRPFRRGGYRVFLYADRRRGCPRHAKLKAGSSGRCKNYDGDVMSDMVATAFGSLSMMTSVLVSPEGNFEFEAAHGTVTRHYYKYLKGESTSTNPVATIFAWSMALAKRGEMDDIPELVDFARRLEKATLDTIESGTMTKDLSSISQGVETHPVDSLGFIKAIAQRL